MSIPGLPALAADIAGLFQQIAAVTADTPGIASTPQWGIFLNGQAVVLSDNVLSVDYHQRFSISNYPVEKGSFASYNKTQHPFEIRVAFSRGGSNSDITSFLESIQSIVGDTNLYDFVTPSAVYTNVNVTGQSYSRSSRKGLGLVTVDVNCEEVRPAALASSTTTVPSTTASAANTSATTLTPNQVVAGSGYFANIDTPQSPTAAPVVNGGQVSPTPLAGQFDLSQALP